MFDIQKFLQGGGHAEKAENKLDLEKRKLPVLRVIKKTFHVLSTKIYQKLCLHSLKLVTQVTYFTAKMDITQTVKRQGSLVPGSGVLNVKSFLPVYRMGCSYEIGWVYL